MTIKVYWNSRIKTFSVMQHGRVVEHKDSLVLQNCKFIVSQKGRERTVRNKTKNVYAMVVGTENQEILKQLKNEQLGKFYRVHYNPYKQQEFEYVMDGSPVREADLVLLTNGHVYVIK